MHRIFVKQLFGIMCIVLLGSCSVDEGQERPGFGLKILGNENDFRGTKLSVGQGEFNDHCIFDKISDLEYDCKVGFRSGEVRVILYDPHGCQIDLGNHFYAVDKIFVWNLSLFQKPGFDRISSKNSCFAGSSLWVKLETFYPTKYEENRGSILFSEGIFFSKILSERSGLRLI